MRDLLAENSRKTLAENASFFDRTASYGFLYDSHSRRQ